MARHRLVFDPQVVIDDWNTVQKYEQSVRLHKSLIYQMTRITSERGSLRHDDRLDALAMAVGYWVEQMGADRKQQEDDRKAEWLKSELDSFMSNALSLNGTNNNNNKWF